MTEYRNAKEKAYRLSEERISNSLQNDDGTVHENSYTHSFGFDLSDAVPAPELTAEQIQFLLDSRYNQSLGGGNEFTLGEAIDRGLRELYTWNREGLGDLYDTTKQRILGAETESFQSISQLTVLPLLVFWVILQATHPEAAHRFETCMKIASGKQ